jgi:hypothetical protein
LYVPYCCWFVSQVLEAIKILKRRMPLKLRKEQEEQSKEQSKEQQSKEEGSDEEGKKPLTETNKFVWVVRNAVGSGFLVQPTALEAPNPKCYTCGNATLVLSVDTGKATLGLVVEKILKARLGMNAPSVTVGASEIYAEGQGLDDDEVELFQVRSYDVCMYVCMLCYVML